MLNSERGFYKTENDKIIFGYTNVRGPGYLIQEKKKESYQYPIYGWYWFETKEQATAFFARGDK